MITLVKTPAPALSNRQKEELAFFVMSRVADLVEYPEMWQSGILADCDPSAVREILATWMRKLPGKMWDTRLG